MCVESERHRHWRNGLDRGRSWGIAARSLLFVVCSAVVLAVVARWERAAFGPLVVGSSAALGTLVLTILFVRWERLRLHDVGVELVRGSLGRFTVAFVVGLSLPLLRAGIVMLVRGLRYEHVRSFTPADVMMTLALYIALASREEFAFRGFPLRMFDREFGPWVAQVVMAVLFVAEHVLGGWTWWQAVFGSGMGALLFGAASLRTRGLAVSIGLHAAWNFGDTMLGGKGTSGLWRPLVDASAMQRVEKTQWVAYVLIMLAAAAAIWYWPRRANETAGR